MKAGVSVDINIKEYRYFSDNDDSASRISLPFHVDGKIYVLLESGEIHILNKPDDKNNAFSYLESIYPKGTNLPLGGEDINGVLLAGGKIWSPGGDVKELIDPLLNPFPYDAINGFFAICHMYSDRSKRRRVLVDVSPDGSSYRVLCEHEGIHIIPESNFFYTSDGGVFKLFTFSGLCSDIAEIATIDEAPDHEWGVFGGGGSAFFISPDGVGSVFDCLGTKKVFDLEGVFHSLGVVSIRQMRYHNQRFVFTYYSSVAKQYLMAVIDPDVPKVVWQSDLSKRSNSYLDFVVVKEFAFVLNDSAVSMIDLSDGSILWRSVYRDSFLDRCRQISDGMICFWSQSASCHGVFLDVSAL